MSGCSWLNCSTNAFPASMYSGGPQIMSQNWRSTWSLAWRREEPASNDINVAIRDLNSVLRGVCHGAFMFGGNVWVISSKNTRSSIKYMMHHVIDHVVPNNRPCQTSFTYRKSFYRHLGALPRSCPPTCPTKPWRSRKL